MKATVRRTIVAEELPGTEPGEGREVAVNLVLMALESRAILVIGAVRRSFGTCLLASSFQRFVDKV
jgi:hypothetical protein